MRPSTAKAYLPASVAQEKPPPRTFVFRPGDGALLPTAGLSKGAVAAEVQLAQVSDGREDGSREESFSFAGLTCPRSRRSPQAAKLTVARKASRKLGLSADDANAVLNGQYKIQYDPQYKWRFHQPSDGRNSGVLYTP